MAATPDTVTFIGFQRPQANYYKMPNVWVEIMAYIDNLSELKVDEYLLRHTWWFQEYGMFKHLTIDEFMYGRKSHGQRMDSGTNLSERAVRNGLNRAEAYGFIEVYVDDSDKARIKKYYRLKMQPEAVETPREIEVQTLHPRGAQSNPRTEKDTVERQIYLSKGLRPTAQVEVVAKRTKPKKKRLPDTRGKIRNQTDALSSQIEHKTFPLWRQEYLIQGGEFHVF